MKLIATLVVLLALVGSAMAWDITDTMQYTNVKTGFQEAGAGLILPQIIGTSSGAYVKEPNDAYGNLLAKSDNTLTNVVIDRSNNWGVPTYSADGNNFYTTLTQGGDAKISTSCKDTIATTPEIVGSADAYQNLWVGGEFAQATSSFDSRAIVGFTNVPLSSYTGIQTPDHFVATDIVSATAGVDANTHGAGLFNEANMGAKVTADISQNYVGSGWASPTYSGGLDMWANFKGACDPGCSNPILTTVSGSAGTGIFPSNTALLNANDGNNPNYGIGDAAYWGTLSDPQITSGYGGTFNNQW